MNIRDFQNKLIEEKLYKELSFSLVETNDAPNLKKFIEEVKPKPNLNIQNELGQTPLIQAAKNPTPHTLKILLDASADITLQDINGNTALMWAAQKWCIASVQALIEAKADVNTKNKDGQTALSFAASSNHINVLHALIEAKADLDAKNKQDYTPLHWATIKRSYESAEVLIEAKADVTAKDKDGSTPLLYLNYSDEANRIRKLIKDATPKKPGWSSILFKPKQSLPEQRPDGYSKIPDEKSSQHQI